MKLATTRDGRNLLAAVVGGVVGAVVQLLAFQPARALLWGDGSVGVVAALTAAVLGGIAFLWSYVAANRRTLRWRLRGRWRRAFDVTGLGLTAAGITVLLLSSLFAVLDRAFFDLRLDLLSSIAVVAATVGASCYLLTAIATEITSTRLATLLGLFLIAGTFGSMLTAEDPTWWHHNFSTLGMAGAPSASLFNVTIIVAGIVLVTLGDYLTMDLRSRNRDRTATPRGVLVVRILLVAIGLALIGVGAVPVNVSLLAHNIFAFGLLAGFAALIVAVPLVVDGLPRSFTAMSTVFVIALVAMVVLFWPIGYFNATAVELLAVLVIFIWVILFTRSVQPPPAEPVPVAPPAEPPRGMPVGVAFVAGAAIAAFVTALLHRGRR